MVRQRRQFSKEFKLEAVRLAAGDRAASTVAREFGIRDGLLRRWRQQFATAPNAGEAFPGHGKLTSQDEELRQLRREVVRLREERDILKKATAFFARESR